MASFVKAAPSCCGIAMAIVRQANRHKTTFILLEMSNAETKGNETKEEDNLFIFSSFEYLN